jgi:hypothetical protein
MCGELSDIRTTQRFKKGYGEGGFVVIRAIKPEPLPGCQ